MKRTSNWDSLLYSLLHSGDLLLIVIGWRLSRVIALVALDLLRVEWTHVGRNQQCEGQKQHLKG